MSCCDRCKRQVPLKDLDAKPKSLRYKEATWELINRAADRGEDFDILQCKDCYGPAWVQGV